MKTFNAVILGMLILMTLFHFLDMVINEGAGSLNALLWWVTATIWCATSLTQ